MYSAISSGGLTEEGTVRGVWSDDAGVLYHDASVKVSVVCANPRLGEAGRAVKTIGRRLEQLAMYFEVSGYDGVQILPIERRGR